MEGFEGPLVAAHGIQHFGGIKALDDVPRVLWPVLASSARTALASRRW
jgi:hypothetical protein